MGLKNGERERERETERQRDVIFVTTASRIVKESKIFMIVKPKKP